MARGVPSDNVIESAVREYARVHWGERGRERVSRTFAANPFHGVPVALGELIQVVYSTKKGGDGGLVDYFHNFEKARPLLAFTPGGLLIVGGDYTVTTHGIEG